MERLQKVLARAGIASRRAAERLIAEGRVAVNGSVVTTQGLRVDPQSDAIRVDGKRIPSAPAVAIYWMVHKPRGYVTTMSDPEGRPTVQDLIGAGRRRLFPVGRLDFQSEGLLLMTDDGELARDLMHPRRGVAKTYAVKVRGTPQEVHLRRLREGIVLEGRKTLPAEAKIVRRGHNSWMEITVVEGRKHQIRKMLEAVAHPVMRLRRVSYGGVQLGDLAPGAVRALSAEEVETLRKSIADKPARRALRNRPGTS